MMQRILKFNRAFKNGQFSCVLFKMKSDIVL